MNEEVIICPICDRVMEEKVIGGVEYRYPWIVCECGYYIEIDCKEW